MAATGGSTPLFDLILGAEIMAARIEAALDADPVIAAHWRAEAAIAEAVASIGLEDVRISEPDLLVRIADSRSAGTDSRAAEDALSVLRFLRAPGDPGTEPKAVLDRISDLSRREDMAAWNPDEGLNLSEDEAASIFSHCEGRMPLIEALRAAALYGAISERMSPVGERLVFVAAEHLSRQRAAARPASLSDNDDVLHGLGGRISARWIGLPSIGLASGQFRIWSPLNPKGARDILDGINASLIRDIGRLGRLRDWQRRGREAGAGRHGRSRLPDAIAMIGIEPVITSGLLSQKLGITQRGAINLIDDLVALGLLREMTRRRAARIWTTPELAARLGARAERQVQRPRPPRITIAPGSHSDDTHPAPVARNLREEGEASMRRAMSEFDEALAEASSILARIKPRQ